MSTDNATARKIELGEMDKQDFGQVLALYQGVFGSVYADRFVKRWTWAYEDNLFPEQTHKWVLKEGDKVIGFLGAIPLPYTIGGKITVAHTPSDYMVHPEYRFHGLKLMKRFFATCPNCVTCDDIPTTIKVTEWLGAKLVAPVVSYTKVLDGRALAASKRFSRLPSFMHRLATPLIRTTDRYVLRGSSEVSLETVNGFDDRFEEMFEAVSRSARTAVAKDCAFLNWRYGPNSPHAGSEIVIAKSPAGSVLGYAVSYLARGRRPSGFVLDLQTVPAASEKVAQALLAHAARRFRSLGALTVKYRALASPFSPSERLLLKLGFAVRNRGGRVLLVKIADANQPSSVTDPANWSYLYGDSEVSHSLA